MPTRKTVDAFTAQVLSGDHVGAIRDWYAEDASMQENQSAPRVGRDLLMDGEARTLARVARVETELLAPVHGHEEVQLALLGADFGDVDVEIAQRVALERLLGSLIAQGLGQPADAVPLEAAVQG